MAFPEQKPAGAPAAPPAAPVPPAAPEAGNAEIGAALKHIATLLETLLARSPEAAAPDVPAAAAAAPGAEDADPEGGKPSGEVGPENEGKEGAGFELEKMPKIEGAEDEDPEAGDNPTLPPPDQDGTGARGGPTPHAAMDAKGVKALIDAAVKAEKARAASVEEARRAVRGVLGEVAMDDAGAIYREALMQSGVDVTHIAKGSERVAWDAFKVGAAAAAGARPARTPAHAADGKGGNGGDTAPAYMKHLAHISVKG